MSVYNFAMSALAGSSAQGSVEGQSLRFNDNDTSFLSWTPASAGNRRTWTWSGWVKRGNLTNYHSFFSSYSSSTALDYLFFNNNDTLSFRDYNGSTYDLATNAVFRDPSAWYHIVLSADTTQATSSDRVKLYVNGELQSLGTATYPSQNYDFLVNSTVSHYIGQNGYNYFDGYLSEVNFVDGTALDPTSFGKTDANGQWVPIQNPSVTYGTNGFYLPFTNDYEVEGFNTVTYRGNGGTQYVGGVGFEPDLVWIKYRDGVDNHILQDSVRGASQQLFSNLTDAELSGANNVQSFESDGFVVGIDSGSNGSGRNLVAWAWDAGSVTNFVTNGDFDQDLSNWSTPQGTVTWDASRRAYLQGPAGVTLRQTITGLDTSKTYYYTARLTRTSGTANFGVDVDGNSNYVSGSSYTNYTVRGFFTPSSSSIVFDVWGGSGMYFYADDIQLFEANTDGSINSAVKASTDYGFSIVGFTSTGSAGTVGHGLSQAPELIIAKQRTVASAWAVYSAEIGATQRLQLQTTDAAATDSSWNNTAPTSTVFSQNLTGTSGRDIIAYCFHSVAGYSDIGSYTGNGSSTGPTVTTGFAPAFVMIKRTDYTAGWIMFDNTRTPYNPLDKYLRADSSAADVTSSSYEIDFNSDGFQLKGTGNDINQSGGTYVYMAFADKREAAFWLDQSGNNNDWTNNNMQESDISLDSPTNNFATLSSIDAYSLSTGYISLSEGNLKCNGGPTTGYVNCGSTFYQNSGKWYVEWMIESRSAASGRTGVGLVTEFTNHNGYIGQYDEGVFYADNGLIYYNSGSSYNTGTTYGIGDVIGYAVDFDAGTLAIYKNNTLVYTYTSFTSGTYYTFGAHGYNSSDNSIVNFGQDSSFAGNKVSQGNTDQNGYGDFYYEPPTGYLALCTQNLPDPAIADGTEHFNTAIYTGNGSTQSITGVGFQPDFTWIKGRSVAYNHQLQDVVRGVSQSLQSDLTAAEANYGLISSFDADGFSVYTDGTYLASNENGTTYVAWNWKAGGTGVANTDGSISSTVSANPTAGFSIVTYTGTGANATVGHGLNSAPDMYIVKNRNDVSNWITYHKDSKASGFDAEDCYVSLNEPNGVTDSTVWNNTAPTSSVFSLGTSNQVNGSSDDMIAYCFHSVEGYSKFGSYEGFTNADGPFVYTGFKPAFIITKEITTSGSWFMFDSKRNGYNETEPYVMSNVSNTEATDLGWDILSNGFKLRNSYADTNATGSTYIYMAFAESPFKYSNAR